MRACVLSIRVSSLCIVHSIFLLAHAQILECMGRAQWLSAPWGLLNEFIHSLTPSEIVRVLLAVWETLIRFPPQVRLVAAAAGDGNGDGRSNGGGMIILVLMMMFH